MAVRPYFDIEITVLGAAGTGSLSLEVANGQKLTINSIRFSSTGAFSITGMRLASGRVFSNAASGNALPGVLFASVANANNGLSDFPMALVIEGNDTLVIDYVDTSGAGNTVNCLLAGSLDDGS